MPVLSRCPVAAARASSPSASIVSRTASAAAHAIGFPPNVLPWSPRRSAVPQSPKPMQAPIGSPPPSPLASVITSGRTPSCWCANQAPVRPIPLWISSSTSSAPASSQACRAACRYPAGRGDHARLALAWLKEHRGAVRPHRRAQRPGITEGHEPDVNAERPERIPDGTLAGQREGRRGTAVEAVLGRDDDRPWPGAAALLPARRTSLTAASLASAPELAKNTRPSAAAEKAEQSLGQGDLALVQEQVGGVRDAVHLAGHRLGDGRVGVAERAHRDAGDQVGVLTAIGVPDLAALAARRAPPAECRSSASSRRAKRSCSCSVRLIARLIPSLSVVAGPDRAAPWCRCPSR